MELKRRNVAGLAGLSLLVLSGCSERALVYRVVDKVLPIKMVDPAPGNEAGEAFRKLQPALSVRGLACAMCHARVNSNVITDFGFGNPYYFDSSGGSQNFYSDWESSWSTGAVQGSVLVPGSAKLDRGHWFINKIDPNGSAMQYRLSEVLNLTGSSRRPAMSSGVTPEVGKEKVVEKSEIYIGAPTDVEIGAIAPKLSDVGFQKVGVSGLVEPELDGLEVVDGVGGKYVRNAPGSNFTCSGDVVVKGTLFLNSAQILTRAQGCRLYVAGAVFIRGRITISDLELAGAVTSHNLQITSSRLVAMGFSRETLGRRFWASAYTRADAGSSASNRHQALLLEAERIPANDLVDAGLINSDGSAVANSEASVPLSRILLNAPEVHSRYVGEFKGAVVAEIAVFRLNNFAFSFDPALQDEKVPILPALKVDILRVKD